ncbi:Exopolyphosphatase [Mortierella claussenii]|nr:Exopolyphosphatase [Mortierella claussenii]
MDTFLTSIRSRLEAEPDAHVILVSGNESADLDSIVSALTTAFFLARDNNNKSKAIVLPFINIPKIDLTLRSDVKYVLSSNHIDSDLIFFRDQLPQLEQLVANDKLSLFLVDHNKVEGTMSSLQNASVVGVIDHHADENLYTTTANPRRVQVVGSCASLVTDEFFKKAVEHEQSNNGSSDIPTWTQQLARFLLGPILIDTKKLDPEFNKVKPLDIAMANLVLPYTGWDSMDDLYQKIDEARHDTSKLSFYDLLRKDYKEWSIIQAGTGQPVKVGISSVVGLTEKYVQRDGKTAIQQAIAQWAQNRSLDLFIVLLSDTLREELGGYQRQMIVHPILNNVKSLPDLLEKDETLRLERAHTIDTDDFVERGGRAYFQRNSSCSRKQSWPLIQKLLTQPATATQPSNL